MNKRSASLLVLAVLGTISALGVAMRRQDAAPSRGPSTDPAANKAPAPERGGAMFRGESELRGLLSGHQEVVPTFASACINCHAPDADATKQVGSTLLSQGAAPGERGFAAAIKPPEAPILDRARLTEKTIRRGGPASSYDVSSLCTVLRSGIDPMSIVINPIMPRYQLSDAECADLWAYLTAH